MIARRLLPVLLMFAMGAACSPAEMPRFDVPIADATMDAAADVSNREVGLDVRDVQDSGPACSSAQIVCNGLCVYAMTDENNCGGCGHACGDDMACYSGVCHTACPTGLTACTDPGAPDGGAEQCVDIADSRLNCGRCGHTCPAAATCSGGVCILDCGTRTLCVAGASDGGVSSDAGAASGYCADLTFDNGNCGTCGHACPPNYICTSARCVIDCVYPQVGCPPAGSMTMSFCAVLNTDPMNCGTCGHVCPTGQTCRGGTCSCAAPALACGATCVDPSSDPANCGTCGRVCTAGVQTCQGGACVACAPRIFCPDGLCTDTASDPANCGACGRACPMGNACVASVCVNRPPAGAYSIPFAAQSTAGTALTLSDDSLSGLIPLGFSFRFFSMTYTSVNISSNGFLAFDAGVGSGCCSGLPIPMADSINNIIAAAWTDLYPPGGASVTYQMRGAAPTRRFVVSYTNVPWCCSGPAAVTTQVILFEGSNSIEIHTTSQTAGHTYTQGVENMTGTMAFSRPGRSAADYALTNDGVRFYTY